MIFPTGLKEPVLPHNPPFLSEAISLRTIGCVGEPQLRESKNQELMMVTWAPLSTIADAGLPLTSIGTIIDRPLASSELETQTFTSLIAGLMGTGLGELLWEDLFGDRLLTLVGGGGQPCSASDAGVTVSGNGWPCGLWTGFQPLNPALRCLMVWLWGLVASLAIVTARKE